MFKKLEQLIENLQEQNIKRVKKNAKPHKKLNRCPNCGANLKGNVCEYCGSVFEKNSIVNKAEVENLQDFFENFGEKLKEAFNNVEPETSYSKKFTVYNNGEHVKTIIDNNGEITSIEGEDIL